MAQYVYEMQGTITARAGLHSEIMTDEGERIHLCPKILAIYGIKQTPKVGDRICFYASRRVDVSYHVESVRMIVSSTLDNNKLRQLKGLNRALRKSRNPDDVWSVEDIEHFTGSIESYDREKGGIIVADTGERVTFEDISLEINRFRAPKPGDMIAFSAQEVPQGWRALEIFSLGCQSKMKLRPAQVRQSTSRSRKNSRLRR
jgi:cold shock CspA family protein